MDLLDHLLAMKMKAKEARSRGRRVHYTVEDRKRAVDFLDEVFRAGGTMEDAAELLSVHRATLLGWVDRATAPLDVQVNVTVSARPSWR